MTFSPLCIQVLLLQASRTEIRMRLSGSKDGSKAIEPCSQGQITNDPGGDSTSGARLPANLEGTIERAHWITGRNAASDALPLLQLIKAIVDVWAISEVPQVRAFSIGMRCKVNLAIDGFRILQTHLSWCLDNPSQARALDWGKTQVKRSSTLVINSIRSILELDMDFPNEVEDDLNKVMDYAIKSANYFIVVKDTLSDMGPKGESRGADN